MRKRQRAEPLDRHCYPNGYPDSYTDTYATGYFDTKSPPNAGAAPNAPALKRSDWLNELEKELTRFQRKAI